jgi:menaquinone-dependent protoporphyrinogen oxidase
MAETRVLVVYATSEGHTAVVAERIADVLRGTVDDVDVRLAEHGPSPAGYDAVVAGGPIHATHHSRHLVHWLERYAADLRRMPTALFQVSLTSAGDDEDHHRAARDLLAHLEEQTGFDPDIVGLFAGALLYTRYGWFKRHVMAAIAKREGGDTDTTQDHDYTDWEAVESFATDIAALVAAADRPVRRDA